MMKIITTARKIFECQVVVQGLIRMLPPGVGKQQGLINIWMLAC